MTIGYGVIAVVLPMMSGLWIDELGTYYVISDDWSDATRRAWRYHGQTPLYYSVVWATSRLIGTSEIALRMPSLVAWTASVFLMWRLACRLLDRNSAIVTVAAFVTIPAVVFSAADVRPYAWGLMFVILSTLALLHLDDSGTRAAAVWYGLSVTLVIYTHYLLATVFLAHLAYYLWCRRTKRPLSHASISVAVIAVGVAPTIPQLVELARRREELSIVDSVNVIDVIESLMPTMLAIVLLAVVTGAWYRNRLDRLSNPSHQHSLIIFGLLVPPITLFLVSEATRNPIWADRYLLAAAPFVALLFGRIAGGILRNRTTVRLLAVVLLAVSLSTPDISRHKSENWQAALDQIEGILDPEDTLLLFANLIEARSPAFFADASNAAYLTSPVSYYEVEQASVLPIPMPTSFTSFDELLEPLIEEVSKDRRVGYLGVGIGGLLIGRAISDGLNSHGFSSIVTSTGDIVIFVFQRDDAD